MKKIALVMMDKTALIITEQQMDEIVKHMREPLLTVIDANGVKHRINPRAIIRTRNLTREESESVRDFTATLAAGATSQLARD